MQKNDSLISLFDFQIKYFNKIIKQQEHKFMFILSTLQNGNDTKPCRIKWWILNLVHFPTPIKSPNLQVYAE